jgi:hypothetical protein
VPGVLAHSYQRRKAAGVDELKACQVDDDVALAGRDDGEFGYDSHGVCYVKLPAQHHDDSSVAFAGN